MDPERSLAIIKNSGVVDDVSLGGVDVLPPVTEDAEDATVHLDWDALQVNEIYDEYEGRLEYIEDDHVFELLGLRDEEEKARKLQE
jgi:hypothetical protein